jgi:hypothetical protein
MWSNLAPNPCQSMMLARQTMSEPVGTAFRTKNSGQDLFFDLAID